MKDEVEGDEYFRAASGLWVPGAEVQEDVQDPTEWQLAVIPGGPLAGPGGAPANRATRHGTWLALAIGVLGAAWIFWLSGALDLLERDPIALPGIVPGRCPASALRPGEELARLERTFGRLRAGARNWRTELEAIARAVSETGVYLVELRLEAGDLLAPPSTHLTLEAEGPAGAIRRLADRLGGLEGSAARVQIGSRDETPGTMTVRLELESRGEEDRR